MNIGSKGLALTFIVAALGSSAPEMARACDCKGHFEIVDPKGENPVDDSAMTGPAFFGFKPDVPKDHFSAHQVRRTGETDNACRRRAREAAQSCMSALWRDRWLLQKGPHKVPECWGTLPDKINHVIRPIAGVTDDLKRDIERAACCGDTPWRNEHAFPGKIFKRTHGDRGCGPNLQTVESRFLVDYDFDCKSVQARENPLKFCGTIELSGAKEEEGYDRLGEDLPGMPLADVTSAARCRDRCIKEHNCRAWTWVRPGFQGPAANCWLKGAIPWAQKSECCSSGTVR